MARLTDLLKLPATLRQELPGQILEDLDDWEIDDPKNIRREIDQILAYYREKGLSKAELNKAKKILTDRRLIDRVRGG